MNNIFAIAMVKDEGDILEHILTNLIVQDVDHFIIANNMSSDNTEQVLDTFDQRFPGRFTLLEDQEPGYYQAQKMNALMAAAVDQGADIILPFDADELWLSRIPGQTVGAVLRSGKSDIYVAEVQDMVGPPNVGNPLVDMAWREPVIKSLPSVAFWWEPGCYLTQGNHDIIRSGTKDFTSLYIRHYQYRSLSQFKRKVRQGKAAYDATDLPDSHGFHWRVQGAMDDDRIKIEWDNIINQPNLIYDPYIK